MIFLYSLKINKLSTRLIELKNETYEEIDGFCYYTNYNIVSGGAMRLYYGINKRKKKLIVAVKIDKEKKKKSSTINEAIILTKLKGIQ